jgi:glyoxalase family protein
MSSSPIVGFHHTTMNVGGAQDDYDFHVKLLGLRTVADF